MDDRKRRRRFSGELNGGTLATSDHGRVMPEKGLNRTAGKSWR
jgi:hypothetical protein